MRRQPDRADMAYLKSLYAADLQAKILTMNNMVAC